MHDARKPTVRWAKDAQVRVEGDHDVRADRSTWKTMAVLEVRPRNVPFLIGWRSDIASAVTEFYSDPAQTLDAKLAMSVGDQPVWFCARLADSFRTVDLVIELVELTTLDDPKYAELPRY